MFFRIFRTHERYSNNPDIQGIIRNFGETEGGGGGGEEQPTGSLTQAIGMSSFFEFLIKAILCMQVKNFTTVYLIARGLQLTLFSVAHT